MEPAQQIVTHITCPIHKDVIRKVGISSKDNNNDLSLLCIECMESIEAKQNQERQIIESFLKQIAHTYSQIPKLQQLPDTTDQILNTENEIVANFSLHIEKQKEIVNNFTDKLRQSVYQKLETKKQQLIENLEGQLKAFEDVFSFYKQKVFTYKQDHQDNQAKGQESAVTFDSLYTAVSKTTSAAELKKLLLLHYDNMRSAEIFTQATGDEAKKIVIDAIEIMDAELLRIQASKPTILFGVKASESFEEVLKVWNEQVDAAINGLKIEVKDPVKPIKFQLRSGTYFDSVILKNDLTSKRMIAEWVFETTKSSKVIPTLLCRGSRDGFLAQNFHEKCDNKGPTIVIIENTAGNKFGGYAAVSWTSIGNTIKTQESFSSFLFSVDKNQKLPYKPDSSYHVLYCGFNYGPVFGSGGGNDLLIMTNCNAMNTNSCHPGASYQNLKEGGYISGTQKFTVQEIEVYSIQTY